MQGITNQDYLKTAQYATAQNLSARVAIHARFSTNPYGWSRWVFDQFAFPPVCAILELGCGPGTLWQQNRQRIEPDWRVTLSDFSAGMVAEAQRTLATVPHPFTFEVIDAQAISLPDQTFDAVLANHMLYHVPDLNLALAEIVRVLKPGGQLYATTIGRDHLHELLELVGRYIPEWVSPPQNFLLENGQALLAPYFTDVRSAFYDDALNVTDTQLLFEYICSLGETSQVAASVLSSLRKEIEQIITQTGTMSITKTSGMLIATK